MHGRTEQPARTAARRAALAVVLSGSLALAGSGCAPLPRGLSSVRQGVEQDDFWVPARFDLVESSDYHGAPDIRSWRGTYRGPGGIAEVVPEYVESMPELGWRLMDVSDEGESAKRLVFFKDDEEARVRIYREFDAGRGGLGTVVDATIRPRTLESFEPGEGLDEAVTEDASRSPDIPDLDATGPASGRDEDAASAESTTMPVDGRPAVGGARPAPASGPGDRAGNGRPVAATRPPADGEG